MIESKLRAQRCDGVTGQGPFAWLYALFALKGQVNQNNAVSSTSVATVLPSTMARFTAYTSDSSSSDEEVEEIIPQKPSHRSPTPTRKSPRRVESDSEEDEESSSSDLDIEDLSSPVRGKNALVETEDGDIQYVHEVRGAGARANANASVSSPPRTRRALNLGDPTIIPWAQHVGVDAQKMHVMQTSLFRMPEEAAALRVLKETAPRPATIKLDVGKHPGMNRKHSRDSDGEGLRIDSREVCALSFFYCFRRGRPVSTTVASHCVRGCEGKCPTDEL